MTWSVGDSISYLSLQREMMPCRKSSFTNTKRLFSPKWTEISLQSIDSHLRIVQGQPLDSNANFWRGAATTSTV